MRRRPAGAPEREADRQRYGPASRSASASQRRVNPGGIGGDGRGAGFSVMAGAPDTIRAYMDEYVATGANYCVCSFQWGNLAHAQAMRSIELFVDKVMPHYV